jgi:D-aminoacyl-tRNA deacylase
MRALIQRVSTANLDINGLPSASMAQGFVVLVGVENDDGPDDVTWLAQKIVKLRLFNDESGLMNLSINQVDGQLMVISQFTLHANTKKGTRPSYIKAAKPVFAEPLYDALLLEIQASSTKEVLSGVFGAHMKIDLTNDGPVTIWLDSKNKSY